MKHEIKLNDIKYCYRKGIDKLENLNICIDTKDLIHAYFYKKYYKMGFSECMKLILDCINI